MSDNPKGDREEWAEAEAKFCDQMVAEYLHLTKGWMREPAIYGEYNAFRQAECMIFAKAWGQMADHLRKPRRARIENEGYRP